METLNRKVKNPISETMTINGQEKIEEALAPFRFHWKTD